MIHLKYYLSASLYFITLTLANPSKVIYFYRNKVQLFNEGNTSDYKVNKTKTSDYEIEQGLMSEERRVKLMDYHHYPQLQEEMDSIANQYPNIATKYNIGTSVEGRDILVMRLTSDAKSPRPILKPMVKFMANMHGDEVVGRELMLALIKYLTSNYGIVPRVTDLLDSLDIHIVPTLNPDGFERNTRENANGIDLNRVFPDIDQTGSSVEALTSGREPEVIAAIKLILDNPFVLSINFHDGSIVVNYPYDYTINSVAELKVFVELSLTYASNHRTMYLGKSCGFYFPGGIVEGASWYIVKGGMMDFNYLYSNCMEVTVELSCAKWPDKSRLQLEWDNNKSSLISFLEIAKSGVRGIVKDSHGNAIVNGMVWVEGIHKHVATTFRGEYWRILTPGHYRMKATSGDKKLESIVVDVTIGQAGLYNQTKEINFTLFPVGQIGQIANMWIEE